MPLTAGGKLKIVASADLGALGAKDGSPVEYNWLLPGVAPLLLPWIIIILLLALKPNRRPAAWLIWLPLGCVTAITLAPPPILPAGTDFFLDAIAALGIGLAAAWLLSNYLRRSHRLLTFFCLLFTLAGFSTLAVVVKYGLSLPADETLQVGIVLAFAAPITAAALSLCGLICRGRYRPAGLCLWLLVSLAGVWLLATAPFFALAEIAQQGRIPLSEFFGPILAVAAGDFALLLPFLILSSASPFYRERLKTLLNIQVEAPPLNPPAPGLELKI